MITNILSKENILKEINLFGGNYLILLLTMKFQYLRFISARFVQSTRPETILDTIKLQ